MFERPDLGPQKGVGRNRDALTRRLLISGPASGLAVLAHAGRLLVRSEIVAYRFRRRVLGQC
jgi:hypothetical protein